MEESARFFLIGVGARAAGSYQLAELLSKREEVEFGFAQEYDVLNAMYRPAAGQRREQIISDFEKDVFGPFESWRESPSSMRLSFLLNPSAYYDYFMWLLMRSSANITGDFSQNYMRLPASDLRKIKDGFAKRGIIVTPVFIMRNPVFLLKSLAENRLKLRRKEVSYSNLIGEMSQIASSKSDRPFFGFTETAEKLRACFGEQAIFLFYEELADKERISNPFKKLGFGLGRDAQRISRIDRKSAIPSLEVNDYIFFEEIFDDTIDSCERVFPQFDYSRYWRLSSK